MALFDQEDTFDEEKDYLAELLGPGGKFDVAKHGGDREIALKAMAKGKAFADRTIDHKNREFDELREDFVKANANATAAEELKRLQAQGQQSGSNNTQNEQHESTLDESKLDQLLEAKLAKIESAKQEKANMDEVERRLKEKFGERAGSILRDKMKSLGMTPEDVKLFARRSPEVALNALGLNATPTESYQGAPSSSLRSDNFVPQADIRDAVFYEKMRRENPKLYFSEKMSVQRLKDMDDEKFMTRYNARQRQP